MKRTFLTLCLLIFISLASVSVSVAQCAMCKAGAETSLKDGNKTAAGLNSGIMYMLLMPYVLVGGLGYYWYVTNKKKRELTSESAE